MTVTKSDAEMGTAQGDASLAGAVYGIYKGEELIDTYTTDKNGQFTTKYYVCGNDWTVREISPSEGYLLDRTIHRVGAEPELYTVEFNSTANDVTEQVIKGNIAIIKHTDNGETQIETPETGATFEVFRKAAGSFDAAKETERDILTCDENGFAQTKDMPYGIYTVRQTSGWEGRELMKPFDVFISKDGQTYRYLINNANFESYIKVVKKDAETGNTIPYAGAGFQIYDPNGNLVTMTFTYPEVTTIDTFYTTADGELITPQTLEYGKGYSLVEVQAPYGYVLNSEPVYFDVMQENSEIDSGITVIEVVRSNMAQKGTITVSKSGEVFSSVNEAGGLYQPVYAVRGLEGAVYEIIAAEDIYTLDGTLRASKGEVVDTVTTGADGTAVSKELYLGKYEVKEITAPFGMVLNEETHAVELVYAGQNVAVTETAASFYNERQRVEIDLIKRLMTDEAYGIGKNGEIFDVTFGLYAEKELTAADGTVSINSTSNIDNSQILQKLSAIFNVGSESWLEVDFSRWGNNGTDNTKFELLKSAVIQQRCVKITYANSYGTISERIIQPLKVLYKSMSWYLKAYCTEKQDYRIFKLTRIITLEVLADTFDKKSFPELDEMSGQVYSTIVLRFAKEISYRVYDEFDNTQISTEENGDLIVSVEMPEDEWLIGYLLSFGTQVDIVEPAHLKDIVAKQAKSIYEKYKS